MPIERDIFCDMSDILEEDFVRKGCNVLSISSQVDMCTECFLLKPMEIAIDLLLQTTAIIGAFKTMYDIIPNVAFPILNGSI